MGSNVETTKKGGTNWGQTVSSQVPSDPSAVLIELLLYTMPFPLLLGLGERCIVSVAFERFSHRLLGKASGSFSPESRGPQT